jgi:glycosyltransferase involved in cell wall biosynthesis
MITLLVPTNRDHRWLRSCLESIKLNGPSFDFEVLLIVNNASVTTFRNIEKVQQEVLPDAKLINAGVGSLSEALNHGLRNAEFEYIARLDSDDELCQGRIEAQIEVLELNPEVALVGTYVQVISEDGNLGRIIRFPVDSSEIDARLKYGNCISHPTVTFRKSVVMNVGMYSNNYPHAEDYDLWLRVAQTSKIRNLPLVGINYRQHGDQVSSVYSAEQIGSTRELAVCAISTVLNLNGKTLTAEDLSKLLSSTICRLNSKLLRKEKAQFETWQYVAFRHSFTLREKLSRISTILLNDPYFLAYWLFSKVRYSWRRNNENWK